MNKQLSIITLILTLIFSNCINAQVKNSNDSDIYRYKDQNGSIFYSDKNPVKKIDNMVVFSKNNGVFIEKKSIQKKDERISLEEKNKQIKKDQELLNKYSSITEIDLMKDYDLNKINKDIKYDMQVIDVLKNKIFKLETDLQLNSKLNDKKNILLLENNKSDLLKFENNLKKNQELYVDKNQMYVEEKKRYIEILKMLEDNKLLK